MVTAQQALESLHAIDSWILRILQSRLAPAGADAFARRWLTWSAVARDLVEQYPDQVNDGCAAFALGLSRLVGQRAGGFFDFLSLPSQQSAKDQLEATDRNFERLSNDRQLAIRSGKLPATGDRTSLTYRIERTYGDWLIYRNEIADRGIGIMSGDLVRAEALAWNDKCEALRQELIKVVGAGSVTSSVPTTVEAPPLIETPSLAIGGIGAIAGGVAVALIVKLLTEKA